MNTTATTSANRISIREKFRHAQTEMNAKLVERGEEISLSLLAIISRQHFLLVGKPGTAKSLLVRALGRWLSGGQVFEWLLTRFTEPDEIFGPISVQGMQNDDYRRLTAHKLPEAHFAFLDEYFKGSSAIINTTLAIMNERLYHNGVSTMACPLMTLFAASNEWPSDTDGGKELGASFDRFLFRKTVRSVGFAGRKKLLRSLDHEPRFAPEIQITPEEIEIAHEEAMALPFSETTWGVLDRILAEMGVEGIEPGDRRLLQSVKACKANAWLEGASEVLPEHLEVLQHTLWEDPAEQPAKVASIVARHANPIGMRVNHWLSSAAEIRASVVTNEMDHSMAALGKLNDILVQIRSCGVSHPRVADAESQVVGLAKDIRLQVL